MATITHSVKSKTEISIEVKWSSDSIITEVSYSLNDGKSWTVADTPMTKSDYYKIMGLTENTKYKIITRVKTKDGKTLSSTTLSVTTYDYPHCIDSPSFMIGQYVGLKFYNPLGHTFTFSIIANGTTLETLTGSWTIKGTEYIGLAGDTTQERLYKAIPNQKSGKYKVKVVYGGHEKTSDLGSTFSINESLCKPSFSGFAYKDMTHNAYTGNGQVLIKNISNCLVYIPEENAMATKNYATPGKYVVSVEDQNKEITKTGLENGALFNPVKMAGTVRINVTAYDSRGVYTTAYKDVTVYDYEPPKVAVELSRKNNYENETTLSISGTYTPLNVNDVNKNSIYLVAYRYRETDGAWGSSQRHQNITLSNGKFTCSNVLLDLDNTKSFEVEVVVRDLLSDETITEPVGIGQATFMISSNKKKAYVLGEEVVTVPALENYLLRERSNEQQLIYYTQLAQNTDLNKIIETGTYRSIQASHTATMKNTPAGLNGGFTMHVYSWTASSTNTEYRRQELIYAQQTYIRHTLDSGATWSAWKRVAYVDDMLSTFFPLYSVYCHSKNENPSSRLGGYWYLSDKGFTTFTTDGNLENPSYYFTPASNVTCNSCYVSRNHSTIRIRLELTIDAAMTDTGMDLGTLKWSAVGITSLPMGYIGQTSYSDGANGGIVYSVDWNTGKITQTDVFDLATIPSGNKFYFDMTFVVPYERMLDSACDKFYFTREVDPN